MKKIKTGRFWNFWPSISCRIYKKPFENLFFSTLNRKKQAIWIPGLNVCCGRVFQIDILLGRLSITALIPYWINRVNVNDWDFFISEFNYNRAEAEYRRQRAIRRLTRPNDYIEVKTKTT